VADRPGEVRARDDPINTIMLRTGSQRNLRTRQLQ
jgi:hypothetical protein